MGDYIYNDRFRFFTKLFPVEYADKQKANLRVRRHPTFVSEIEHIVTSTETKINNYIV